MIHMINNFSLLHKCIDRFSHKADHIVVAQQLQWPILHIECRMWYNHYDYAVVA